MRTIRNILTSLMLAVVVLTGTGCGTIVSFSGGGGDRESIMDVHPPLPFNYYYGVCCDLLLIQAINYSNSEVKIAPKWTQILVYPDIPLSACCDTICLPYTIYRVRADRKAHKEELRKIMATPLSQPAP